ncbi:GIY-YIG nuclease family protein [Hydrogenophaga sp. D2P1]|uniref:GIY-YIG nuclease family protein n=1 Tax=Hydrogenophaga aromaticivorans TaxID=2610898 RepID=A0A7Y8KXU2_9BURK|nr:GIY-YIG nuclease family protein [Hydrogenophaga aromaticivorans]
MIYAVHILNSQYVKIGYSGNPDVSKRISELQTGSPFEIKPLFTVDGTLRQEQAIHSVLREVFTQVFVPMPPNEWYPGRMPAFQKFLMELRTGGAANALAHGELYTPLQAEKGVRPGSDDRHNLKVRFKWAKKAESASVQLESWGR